MINKLIAHVLPYMPEKLIWQFSKRYIAGETMDDGISVARQLNAEGVLVTIDLLGEFITKLEQAEENMKVSGKQYEVGLETLSDYLEAQMLWQQAYQTRVDAHFQLYVNYIAYLKAAGQLQ